MNIASKHNTNEIIVLGIDNGYGNTKTSHTCFKSGLTAYDKEPPFKSNLLIYNGKYYIIGDEHKDYIADKSLDDDFYILTLAALAKELNYRGMTSAKVHLAAGLPLTWVSEQRESFKAYLLQNEVVDFSFKGVDFHVEFVGAEIFPQGFAAIADKLGEFKGMNMLCDIGNGTMNIMLIRNGRPIPSQCFTEKYGVHQCVIMARERLRQKFGAEVDESIIEDVLRHGDADIGKKYLDVIHDCAKSYTDGIMRKLRSHEYNPDLMRLYVMGGGSCLIKNFTEYDHNRVTINSDLCATAKGYERMAQIALKMGGGIQ